MKIKKMQKGWEKTRVCVSGRVSVRFSVGFWSRARVTEEPGLAMGFPGEVRYVALPLLRTDGHMQTITIIGIRGK